VVRLEVGDRVRRATCPHHINAGRFSAEHLPQRCADLKALVIKVSGKGRNWRVTRIGMGRWVQVARTNSCDELADLRFTAIIPPDTVGRDTTSNGRTTWTTTQRSQAAPISHGLTNAQVTVRQSDLSSNFLKEDSRLTTISLSGPQRLTTNWRRPRQRAFILRMSSH